MVLLSHDEARDLGNRRHLVPMKRPATLDQKRVDEIAASELYTRQRCSTSFAAGLSNA